MINIYGKNNTNYNTNGDATLIPIRADLNITLNGSWQLEVEVPYDKEKRYELIEEGAVIICDVGCIRELASTRQRFRIYDYKKGISSVTAIAFPVAMECTHDAPIDNLVISGKTGVQAMAQIQAKTSKYTLYSDITRTGSTSFANTNVNNAIASGSEGCFIDVWGGEIVYDNLKFSVLNRVGNNEQDKHKIIYGKDITDISYEKDDSGLITRIYPISSDGIRLNGSGYVDSPKVSQYPIVHSRYMSAPYKLIEDDIASSTATAQLTRSIKSQITTLASSLSHSVYNTAVASKVEPEYIRKIKADILSAVQSMATADIYNADANKVMQSAIKDGMEWLKDVSKAEWVWHGSDATGWWYGSSTSDRATSQYVYIDRVWSYFGDNSLWQKPRDDASKKWDWIQEASGKRYGNKDKYYAQKTYVYITMDGQMKEYYFDDDGIWDESDDTDSDYAWHGSGSSSDPYWFGDDSTTGKYLKDGWWFIDGTYYYFDSEGYWDNQTKFDDYQWDWVETADGKYWFGNPDKTFAMTYVTNQWLKVGGDWYRFDANGYAVGDTALENEVIARFTSGMAQLKTLCETLNTQAFNLLYSQMRSYCTKMFNTGIDVPSVTITVNMADLSNTSEYAKYQHLEKVYLGDSVTALDYKHNISAVERIVSITYDCIKKVNAVVEIGVASSSLSDILKTDAGGSVAGGFDTSVIENTLTNHTNELARLDSAKQDKLTAGENITIVNNVISATGGGGSKIYNGTGIPSASLGSNGDAYFRIKMRDEDILSLDNFDCLTSEEYPFELTDFTVNSRSSFSFKMGGVDGSAVSQGGYGETAWFTLDGLVEGNTYTIDFDFQFVGTTFLWQHENNALYIRHSDNTMEKLVYFATDNNVHSYSATFEYSKGDKLYFTFHDVTDYVRWDAIFTNLNFTGEFIEKRIWQIYGKINDEWLLYYDDESGTQVIANPDGEPTDVLSKVSIEDVIYEIEKTDVEANPSDPATESLNKLGIDGTIYNIEGGGGNALIVDAQIYSLDEQVIGVWTDNKPLYEKTIYIGTMTRDSSWHPTAHGISNIEKVVEVYGQTKQSTDGRNYSIPHYRPSNQEGISVGADTTNVYYMNTWLEYASDTYVTVRYTKTTDIAGSGGYQAYGFSPVIYSSEEREIGVGENNKPLYQKTVVSQTLSSETGETVLTGIDSLKVISLRTNIYYPFYVSTYSIGGSGTEYGIVRLTNNGDVELYNAGRSTSVVIEAVLQYTKSSDVAGSGSYNTLGVPTVHYTTDEQVIGTWVDGKPLYRRTFYYDNQSGLISGDNKIIQLDSAINVTKLDGFLVAPDINKRWILPYSKGSSTTAVIITDDHYINLYVNNDSWASTRKVYITIEYTKTTD